VGLVEVTVNKGFVANSILRIRLSDSAISRFTAACPNLIHIDMDSACDLTDAGLSAICRNCPNIEFISINRNDKCRDHIGGTALDVLRVDKKLASRLEVLGLIDQSGGLVKAVKKLGSARKGLEITLGKTRKWGDGTIEKFVGGTNILDI
jgi:hypothetical protein